MSEQPQQPHRPAQEPYDASQQPYVGPPQGPYGGSPQPYGRPMSVQDERTWGLVAHLSWLAASLIVLPFLGPLVVFLVFKDRSRFVREHAAEALNMNIALIAYVIALSIVFTIIGLLTLGFGFLLFYLLFLPSVAALVFSILAAVAASQGRAYRYPLIFRLVH